MANFATKNEGTQAGIESGFNSSSDSARSQYDKPMQTPDDSGHHVSKQVEPVSENPAGARTGSYLSDKK